MKGLIPHLLEKWYFWPPKYYGLRHALEKISFSSTLNVMI
jgi:hypothetical protein